jgi:eukaryotic-like serine/threonine-protein kinase
MASEPQVRQLRAGAALSHYQILSPLGAGGMGVVYRAADLRLNRTVALKVIGGEQANSEARRRLLKEARAASAFNHPHIVTIHEVDTAGGIDFIVMELVSGDSLDKRIAAGALTIDDVVATSEQIASALAAAHAAGVVHRDIKPSNVMLGDSGHVKLLDFGIAKQAPEPGLADAATASLPDLTAPGAVLGSVSYMSPEQAQGRPVDGRSDVFSLGVLMYEMLSGRKPFGGSTTVETVAKILEAAPPNLASFRQGIPAPLAALVSACLEKDRNNRPSAADVNRRLTEIQRSRTSASAPASRLLRRAVAAAAAVLVAAAGASAWWWWTGRDVREARRRLPAILELGARGDSSAFYREASAVLPLLPDEPLLNRAWTDLTFAIPEMKSDPPGAEVLAKGYDATDDAWVSLGRTPLTDVRFPRGTSRLKIVKDGFAPYDGTTTFWAIDIVLDPVSSVPDGMTRVPSGPGTNEGRTFSVPAFWMDRFEVSNRQFKAFVDAGGYTNREYWKQPFAENGRDVSWETAMARFRDRTGRPGPSTWELGTFPQAQADFPVSGVSWYEALAYAAFAGKSLPTAFQWRRAGDFNGPSGLYGDILVQSNFDGKGPRAIGSRQSIGPYGQFDMAGNVKEWCWNESGTGRRMILGGGWNEPQYMYEDRDAQPPFSRLDTYGFRLVKNIDAQPEASVANVPPLARDYSVEKPIDDSAFKIAARLYTYDRGELSASLERTEDAEDWRRETVTLDAAYRGERIIVYLYLPKSAAPPYQTVVYFPGGDATLLRSSRELNLLNVDFVIRSGRALVYPVYQGTYERSFSVTGPNAARELAIARVKDFGRVADYLATRQDLDADRMGYYGVSLGAFVGTVIGAVDPRLKAIVFMGGGLGRTVISPEVDPLNFVPRIKVPTLMVNGDNDFQFPLQTSQLPEFRLLSLPADQKRHALFSGGHMPTQIHDVMREILDWFDRFLGPVSTRPRSSP